MSHIYAIIQHTFGICKQFQLKAKCNCKEKIQKIAIFLTYLSRFCKELLSYLTIIFFIMLDLGPHFLCWILGVVPINTWVISSWEENSCCLQAEQLTKWWLFSLKITTLTILSEAVVILCICSACINIFFFLSLR